MTNILEVLNKFHARNPDPDAIVAELGKNGWVHALDFTEEATKAWYQNRVKVGHFVGRVFTLDGNYDFTWRVRNLQGNMTKYWFIPLNEFREGKYPDVVHNKNNPQ